MAKVHDYEFTDQIVRDAFERIKAERSKYKQVVVDLNTSPVIPELKRDARSAAIMASEESIRAIAEEAGAQVAAYLKLETAN